MKYVIIVLCLLLASCSEADSQRRDPVRYDISTNEGPLRTGWYTLSESPNSFPRQLDKDTLTYYINPGPILIAANIVRMELYENNHYKIPGLGMYFDKKGTEAWRAATANYVGHKLVFILNDTLLYAATVQGEIDGGVAAICDEKFSEAELNEIKKQIEEDK